MATRASFESETQEVTGRPELPSSESTRRAAMRTGWSLSSPRSHSARQKCKGHSQVSRFLKLMLHLSGFRPASVRLTKVVALLALIPVGSQTRIPSWLELLGHTAEYPADDTKDWLKPRVNRSVCRRLRHVEGGAMKVRRTRGVQCGRTGLTQRPLISLPFYELETSH